MKYTIQPTNRFKKDLKTVKSRGYNLEQLTDIINTLAAGYPLLDKYKDHALQGSWSGYRECHIQPDWLLIYQIDEIEPLLYLIRTGTHSDLF